MESIDSTDFQTDTRGVAAIGLQRKKNRLFGRNSERGENGSAAIQVGFVKKKEA